MSTLRVTTLQTQAGVEVYTAKAWVNFNGTGTVAIRASGNVSSITDNGTGDYTLNFTVAMTDTNYSVLFQGAGDNDTLPMPIKQGTTPTTTAVRVACFNTAVTTAVDRTYGFVAIFR